MAKKTQPIEGQDTIFAQGRPNARDPKAYVIEACYWIKRNNRQAFNTLCWLVDKAVDRGEIIQRGDIYYLAKQAGMSVSEARELKRDNNLFSVLARYMVMLQPRRARALNFKLCGVDTVDLIGEWRDIVNAGTTFLALSWQEAKELCAAGDACAL